jgi:hypothetical protein
MSRPTLKITRVRRVIHNLNLARSARRVHFVVSVRTMPKKLNDAISAVMLHAASGLKMRDFEPELRLLIHAARAFSCEKCGGIGKHDRPIIRWAVSDDSSYDQIECEECKGDRAEIKIYG